MMFVYNCNGQKIYLKKCGLLLKPLTWLNSPWLVLFENELAWSLSLYQRKRDLIVWRYYSIFNWQYSGYSVYSCVKLIISISLELQARIMACSSDTFRIRSSDILTKDPLDYGGFGEVFLCRHKTLGPVVLKSVFTGFLRNEWVLSFSAVHIGNPLLRTASIVYDTCLFTHCFK